MKTLYHHLNPSIMSTIICRVGYCANCARRHSPHYSDSFLAYGSTSNDYVVYRSRKESDQFTFGFTPHLYKLGTVENGIVSYQSACSMYNCDCMRIQTNLGNYFYYISEEKWKLGFMPLKEWNALVTFKKTGYRI